MLPLLQPGEEVLVDPTAYVRSHSQISPRNSIKPSLPQSGDIVVARQPHNPDLRIIKWVVFVEDDGRCYLQGLNLEESTDSRRFGLVSPTLILGRVVCRFP
ncbi:MAG TPA: S26 family signal peptidase [Leptolyngbyaceae cyanobacterium]